MGVEIWNSEENDYGGERSEDILITRKGIMNMCMSYPAKKPFSNATVTQYRQVKGTIQASTHVPTCSAFVPQMIINRFIIQPT